MGVRSAVEKATRLWPWRLRNAYSTSGREKILALLQIMQVLPGTHPTLCVSILETPSPGGEKKTNGFQVALLPPSTVKVKNDCTCAPCRHMPSYHSQERFVIYKYFV
jgi:hypothetical protein